MCGGARCGWPAATPACVLLVACTPPPACAPASALLLHCCNQRWPRPACSCPADTRQRKKQRRKATKQQLLAEAEGKVAAAPGLAASAEGKAALEREAWGTALQRAKGDKVFDDPRLLKKSIKKVGRQAGSGLLCTCEAEGWLTGCRPDLNLHGCSPSAPGPCLTSAALCRRPS